MQSNYLLINFFKNILKYYYFYFKNISKEILKNLIFDVAWWRPRQTAAVVVFTEIPQ